MRGSRYEESEESEMDKRVEAIRNNKLVGRGSCTSIDECYDDGDLADLLDAHAVYDPDKAVQWVIDRETEWLEGRCERPLTDGQRAQCNAELEEWNKRKAEFIVSTQ